jgi:hypothetical protein
MIVAAAASDALSFQKVSGMSEESGFLPKEQLICNSVKDKIKAGGDVKAVVKTSIQLGYRPCVVVRCAIDGGGNVEAIIGGALAAGATSDVVSKCAIEAGADITAVVKGLQNVSSICYVQPFGYSTPEGTPPAEPIPPPPPSDPPHISNYVP